MKGFADVEPGYSPQFAETLDEIERLNHCLQAVADMMAPEPDLQAAQLDRIAMLMDYLTIQQQQAAARLRRLD